MSVFYEGADPGVGSGAVVALAADGKTVIGWIVWLKMTRKNKPDAWRVREWTEEGVVETEFGIIASVFDAVRFWGKLFLIQYDGVVLAVEKMFVPTWTRRTNKDGSFRKMSMQDSLKTAASAGRVMQALEGPADVDALRVLSNTWRPESAGIPAQTDAKRAEQLAISFAARLFFWPGQFPKLTRVELGAVCEAAFIARWGWIKKRPALHFRR